MASFFSDLFGGADNAAKDQTNGILMGLTAGNQAITAGNNALNTNYTAALQPFLTNFGTAQQGVTALGNLMGLNGPAGSQNAQAALTTMPGYQFTLGQGDNAINAAAAANGTLGSGNQQLALQKFGQGLANQNYGNYVSQLMPYLGMSQGAASGIGNTYTGLGTSLNANQNNLANLDVGAFTGIGNANASADLANQNMGLGLLGGLGKFITGGGLGSIGSALGGLGSIFSDERLKENIEPVGELFDGTNVYRYNYKGDGTPHIGVMAQEIERATPEAVHEIGGFKAVNYGAATELAAALGKFLDYREAA